MISYIVKLFCELFKFFCLRMCSHVFSWSNERNQNYPKQANRKNNSQGDPRTPRKSQAKSGGGIRVGGRADSKGVGKGLSGLEKLVRNPHLVLKNEKPDKTRFGLGFKPDQPRETRFRKAQWVWCLQTSIWFSGFFKKVLKGNK